MCYADDLELTHNNAEAQSYADTYLVDAVVSYECTDGHSGCVTAKCLSNGQWQYSGECETGNEPPLMLFLTEVERITL